MASSDEYQLNQPVPYQIHVDDDLLSLTKRKLKLARYPNELEDLDEEDWSHGSKVAEVKRLAKYWEDGFDWRAQEVRHQRSAAYLH